MIMHDAEMEKSARLEQLRQKMSRLEFNKPDRRTVPLGVAALDEVLAGGLEQGAMHEIGGPAATLLTCLWLQKIQGPIVWVSLKTQPHLPFMPGLAAMGVDPARILCVQLDDIEQLLSATHQALSDREVGAVVVDMAKSADLSQARQLQLAAQAGNSVGLGVDQRSFLSHSSSVDPLLSCAMTRWSARVCAQQGDDIFLTLELEKNRRGKQKAFQLRLQDLDLDYAAYHVCLATTSIHPEADPPATRLSA